MRLLVFGHHSHTGFGVVTENIAGRLAELGVDVRVLALNHRGEPIKGRLAGRVWPLETLTQHFQHAAATAIQGDLWSVLDPEDAWEPDAVLVIADMSGLHMYVGQVPAAVEVWKTKPVYHYCPIEGDNLPPYWGEVWSLFQPIAMSKYGAKVIGDLVGHDVPMIYHGVDTEAFYPVSPGRPIRVDGDTLRTKDDCKRKFAIGFERVLLRTDRNVVRKNYDALLRAFVPIARADPGVGLVLHCHAQDGDGYDLVQEIRRLPEDVAKRVAFTGSHDTFKGLPVEGLNALYNAADIYISTTGGEGFGLTLAEALSAGVPVVATGWAAEIEVVGDGGVMVPPLYDSYGEPVRDHSRYGMDWAVPDPKAFTEPVLNLLSHRSRRSSMGALGRLHVQRSFSWDTAAAQFLDLFAQAKEAAA